MDLKHNHSSTISFYQWKQNIFRSKKKINTNIHFQIQRFIFTSNLHFYKNISKKCSFFLDRIFSLILLQNLVPCAFTLQWNYKSTMLTVRGITCCIRYNVNILFFAALFVYPQILICIIGMVQIFLFLVKRICFLTWMIVKYSLIN